MTNLIFPCTYIYVCRIWRRYEGAKFRLRQASVVSSMEFMCYSISNLLIYFMDIEETSYCSAMGPLIFYEPGQYLPLPHAPETRQDLQCHRNTDQHTWEGLGSHRALKPHRNASQAMVLARAVHRQKQYYPRWLICSSQKLATKKKKGYVSMSFLHRLGVVHIFYIGILLLSVEEHENFKDVSFIWW